nr:YidC/Oxa1 family membrane protein insertase [uncultured Treponema sp.]
MLNFLYTIIIYPLYQLVEVFYSFCDAIFYNPGLAVVGVSIGISFLCLPMYIIAEKWQETEREIQLKLKPGVDRIKAVFKGDEQYMILTTYYRQNHYHPMMALRSSISLLIQIPFFIAAYKYLSTLPALNGKAFLFIKDMGSPDALFHIGSFPVNVLPIAMTLINVVAGFIYTKGHPIKEKLQIYLMAAFFLVFLYDSPSGLVLYWTMNNVFSLVKNVFYKIKKPIRALYILLCVVYAGAVWFLLFKHSGFLFRRLAVIGVLTIVPAFPLILKAIKYLLDKPFASLVENGRLRDTLFFLSAITLSVLCGWVIPSYIISSSPMEFSFVDNYASPFYFLRNSLFQSMGFCLFWTSCLYYLFNKRVKAVFTILLSIITLCAMFNAFVFGGSYGSISTILTFENAGMLRPDFLYAALSILSNIAVIIAVYLLLKNKKFKICTSLFTIILISMVSVSVVNSVPISKGYKELKEIKESNSALTPATISPVFHLSKDKQNVILIMLDRGLTGLIPYIFEEKPFLYEQFDGFTRYENTVSYGGMTLIGAPPVFGGYEYTPANTNRRDTEALIDKHNESLKVLPVLFSQNGFTSTVTDMSWADYKWIPDLRIYKDFPDIRCCPTERVYLDEWLKQNPDVKGFQRPSELLKRNFIWLSFFKIMLPVTREFIYEDGHWWRPKTGKQHLHDFLNYYSALDLLPELSDDTGDKPTFSIIVNDTPHEPVNTGYPDYNLTTTDETPGPFKGDNAYQTNAAAFIKLGEFMKHLKDIGVYDNTRIIIASDHGGSSNLGKIAEKKYPHYFNPLLLVKDFNEHGTLKVDDTFMTNADAAIFTFDGIIENAVNPFTGKVLKDQVKKDIVYVARNASWSPEEHTKTKFIVKTWNSIHDNIFESDNWKEVKEEEVFADEKKQ